MKKMKDRHKEIADLLIDSKCYVNYGIEENRKIETTSGDIVPAYLSCRSLISQGEMRKKVENALIDMMKEIEDKNIVIVGLATAGITWAHSIAEKLNLPMLYVRSKKKEYGLGGCVEGGVENIHNRKAIIVDDVLYSGESFNKAKDELSKLNIETLGVLTICSLKDKTVEKLESKNIKVLYLTDAEALTEKAYEVGILNSEELKIMRNIYESE